MKALTVAKSRVFASALLALTLFGVAYPYRVNATTVHHRVNMTEETRQSADVSEYMPTDSPGSQERSILFIRSILYYQALTNNARPECRCS